MYKQEAVNNKIIHPLQFTMILKILNNGKKCGGNNSNVFVTDIFPIQIFNKYNVDQYITVVKLYVINIKIQQNRHDKSY